MSRMRAYPNTRPARFRPLTALSAVFAVAASLLIPTAAAHAITGPTKLWEQDIPGGAIGESSPLIANLDGHPDVVVGDLNGDVYAMQNDNNGNEVAGWPFHTGTGVDASPSAADIDNSGNQTVFVGSGTPDVRGGDFFAINHDGTKRWSFHPGDADFPSLSMFSSPAIGDVNGDGRPDVSAFSLGLQGWSYSADGAMNKGWPFYQDDTVFSSPALYDWDGDGIPEYVVGGDSTPGGPVDHRGGFLRVLKGNGQLLWSYGFDEMVRSSPIVGDMDGNGSSPEIAVGTGDYWVRQPGGAQDSTKLFVFNSNGTVRFIRDLGGYTDEPPVMAHLEGTANQKDVIEGTWSGAGAGHLFAFDNNGNQLWNIALAGGPVLGQVSTADFNGDGYQDVVVPTGAGIYVYDGHTGAQLFTLPLGTWAYQNAPLITVDGNGKLDIIVAGTRASDHAGVVQSWEMPTTTGASTLGVNGVPQFRMDNRHTGSLVATNMYNNLCTGSPGKGYWMAGSDGGVYSYCNAQFYGSAAAYAPNSPTVAITARPDHAGYWEVTANGSLYSFGSAASHFYGTANQYHPSSPIVGMAVTPSGNGYWQVAADGGIFAFGDAGYYGSMGGQHLNAPIVGMAAKPDGSGYWLVGGDGGIFSFGNAHFFGSTGSMHLNQPVVGMTPMSDGNGYWFVASDGGIFSYGSAASGHFFGSMGGQHLNSPVVGMAANADSSGYRLVAGDGGIFSYNAPFLGSTGAININAPIIGMAIAN